MFIFIKNIVLLCIFVHYADHATLYSFYMNHLLGRLMYSLSVCFTLIISLESLQMYIRTYMEHSYISGACLHNAFQDY